MTQAEWDAEWQTCFVRLQTRGLRHSEAFKAAHDVMRASYGPRPSKPSLWLRIGLKLVGRKLAGLKPVQEVIMKERIIASLLFGAGVVIATLQNELPHTPEGWVGIVIAFFIAAYGKFSSNTTLIGANRKVWTPEERAQAVPKG